MVLLKKYNILAAERPYILQIETSNGCIYQDMRKFLCGMIMNENNIANSCKGVAIYSKKKGNVTLFYLKMAFNCAIVRETAFYKIIPALEKSSGLDAGDFL